LSAGSLRPTRHSSRVIRYGGRNMGA
jgi:hypothetical protein